ncbi:MAG: transposase family protein [Treponema sp.]|jgi:hypothetical protein|nr:transposase family protein [Treponema sp.]
METRTIAPLAEYFKDVKDPRIERKKLYPLNEVIIEPVPKLFNCALKAHGFGTGSWKKRLEARFFP